MLTCSQIVAAYMPAVVILVTVLMGAVSNNRALEQVGKRIDDLRNDTNKGIDDLGDRLDARFDRLEARLEHPIARP